MLHEIFNVIKKLYGEEHVEYGRRNCSNFISIRVRGIVLLYLIKSGSGDWICIFEKKPRFKELSPFLIKDIFSFENYLKYVNCLLVGEALIDMSS